MSFAVGAGAFNADKKEKGAGGIGGKMTPSAVFGDSEWSHQACEYQESGYDH